MQTDGDCGKQDLAELIDYMARLEAASLSPLSALLYQTWLSRNQSPSGAESDRFQDLVAALTPQCKLVTGV
jgi:hypothetical protein